MLPFLNRVLVVSFLLCIIATRCRAQQIGLELYSLRNQFEKDVPGTMAKVKAMGFKEVEMTGTYGLDFPAFIKILAQNELSVISFGADFNKLRDFPQALADEARSYGAKFVVCFWIPHEGDTFTQADVDSAAEVFNKAGQVMARNGLLLCYHPHGYEFGAYEEGTLFDYMMEKFDNRFVQLEMDVFWIKQAGQDPIALLRKYHSRWILMHLKDRKPGTPDSDNGKADDESNVVLGEGDVGIAAIVKEAKEYGIRYFFIEDESSRAEEQIPKSVAFFNAIE